MARRTHTVGHTLTRLRQRLLADSSARLVVLVAITLAGATGFLVSAIALSSGVEQMAVRYLVAALVAYAVFLLLLSAWVRYRRGKLEPDFDLLDLDIDVDVSRHPSDGIAGGKSGGGGGGDTWDPTSAKTRVAEDAVHGAMSEGFGLDVEELWWALVVFAILLGGVLGVLYVLYLAPALLAEAILDGIVAAAVYRRLRRRDVSHWSVGTLLRRTWKPAALVIASVALAGFATQLIFPEAHSIGDVIRRFQS